MSPNPKEGVKQMRRVGSLPFASFTHSGALIRCHFLPWSVLLSRTFSCERKHSGPCKKKGKTAPFSQVLFHSEHVHSLLTTQECPCSLLLLSTSSLKQVRLPSQCHSQPAKRNPQKGDAEFGVENLIHH